MSKKARRVVDRSGMVKVVVGKDGSMAAAPSPLPEECRTFSPFIFVNRKLYHFVRMTSDVAPVPEFEIVNKKESEKLSVIPGRYDTLTQELWWEIKRGMDEIESDYEAGVYSREVYEGTCGRYLRLLKTVESVGAGIAGRGLPRDLS